MRKIIWPLLFMLFLNGIKAQEMRFEKSCQGLLGDPIQTLAVAPSESFVMAGTQDGKVLEINPDNCQTLRTYQASESGETIRAIAVGPHERYFATGGDDGRLTIWKRGNPLSLDVMVFTAAINSIHFLEKSTSIWVGSLDGSLHRVHFDGKIFRMSSGDEGDNRHVGGIFDMDVDLDANLIATGGKDNMVKVSALDQVGSSSISIFEDDVNIVRVSDDGASPFIFAGIDDGTIKIWNQQNPTNASITWSGFSPINSACFDTENDCLYFTTSYEQFIRVLPYRGVDANNTSEPRTVVHPVTLPLASCISPKRGRFFTGGEDGNLYIWTIQRGAPMVTWDPIFEEETIGVGEVTVEFWVDNMEVIKAAISVNGGFQNLHPLMPKGSGIAASDYYYQETLVLKQGMNEVILMLTNELGETESFVKKINVDKTPARNFLLCIGINNYRNGWEPLYNAVNDATAVKKMLIENYQFVDSSTILLLNEQATEQNILDTLLHLVDVVTPNDNVLIYFAGHGDFETSDSLGAWIPVESKKHSKSSYLLNTTIIHIVSQLKSLQTLVVSDACFAGQLLLLNRGGDKKDPYPQGDYGKYLKKKEKNRARRLIGSGVGVVKDSGKDKDTFTHSPFARAFLHFLNRNQRPKLGAKELARDVEIRVSANFTQVPIYGALKGTGDQGGDFIFVRKPKK